DDYLLQDLANIRERVGKLKQLLDAAQENFEQAQRVLSGLTKPLTREQWFAVVGAVAAVTVIGILALKALLWTSFAETLLTPFFEGLGINDAATVSASHAEVLVL